MSKTTWGALLLAVLLPMNAQAESKKIQCWNDNNGKRMCGDRVPPEYAGQKREIIQDGRVVETKRGAKTSEELAADERAKQEAEEAKKRADYDRSLLESYRNAKDIQNMRDERLAMLDVRIRAAEKSTAENQKTLEDLRARAAQEKANSPPVESAEAKPADGAVAAKPADSKLTKQVRQYEKSLADSEKSMERLKNERDQTEKKFAADEKRYNELRPPPPPKKPAS